MIIFWTRWGAGFQRSGTYYIRGIGRLYASTIEQETNGARLLPLTITEGVHKFLEGSGTLDLEEDLVVVVRHLDVEMLGGRLWLVIWLITSAW